MAKGKQKRLGDRKGVGGGREGGMEVVGKGERKKMKSTERRRKT